MFIVFEGIDGSGKSEQVRLLATALEERGIPVRVMTTADGRPIRKLYRELIASRESFPTPLVSLLLGMSDFAQLGQQIMSTNGEFVILVHRYVYSALADAIALSAPVDNVETLVDLFPRPDATILVKTPPEVALARKGDVSLAEAGGPEFASRFDTLSRAFITFQGRVGWGYARLIERGVMGDRVFEVDGSETPERVQAEIQERIFPLIERSRTNGHVRHAGVPEFSA